MRIVVFSGTTEGRDFSRAAAALGIAVTVSVATDLGAEEQGQAPGITVHSGRLLPGAMAELLQGAALCVDATHPYAVEATKNIRAAANAAGIEYHRLLRAASTLPAGSVVLGSAAQAAQYLAATQGNVLLTTGAKELICHKDFQRFMLDAEIYVDRIADMRVNDMNAVLEAVRQMALMKNGGEENDLHLRTLEVAQIREDEYFGSLIADDLKGILRDIRSEHRPDTMTADEISLAATMQDQLQDAMNFEGSSEEKKAKALLSTLGIDYDAITMEQFVNLIEVLKLSKHLKTPISQRGKTTMTHGKGKRKKR